MLSYVIICIVAIIVSALTLFSGFGLGTLLMPAFALFFPLPIAIAATAVVHLANNIFKAILVGKKADWHAVLRFALPGAAAAILGAWILTLVSGIPTLFIYSIGSSKYEIDIIKLVIGFLIIVFAFLDLIPRMEKLSFDRKYLPLGGAISGFFGGLSGIQGALRSAFLIKAGLDKDAFIGTGTVSAVIVDIARLLVYGVSFYTLKFTAIPKDTYGLIAAAIIAAFAGSFIGARLVKKVTLRAIQIIVGIMLLLVGIGMISGLI
jgi:uncharacterized membrane protein YfcA